MSTHDALLLVFIGLCVYAIPAYITAASILYANQGVDDDKTIARTILGAIFWPIVAAGAILYCIWWVFYHAFKKED